MDSLKTSVNKQYLKSTLRNLTIDKLNLSMIRQRISKYRTQDSTLSQVIILTEKENIVELNKPATWIKANNDFRMYYITNYDLVGWKKLYHQLVADHTVFTTTGKSDLRCQASL